MLAPWQERQITKSLTDLIETANSKLLNELTSGYSSDLDDLIEMLRTNMAEGIFQGKRMENLDFSSLQSMAEATHETLCKHSYNYFKTTMIPDFNVGWRNIEWGNLLQMHPFVSFLCSRGSGKCFAPGTEVLMYNNTIKKIENVQVGDKVMGPDNSPRTVLSLHKGEDTMYKVHQRAGCNYSVNSEHILYFHYLQDGEFKPLKIRPGQFINKNKEFKRRCFGVSSKLSDQGQVRFLHDIIKVERIGRGKYYGFSCDGDHLFIGPDGTIYHNSFEFCYAFLLWRLYTYSRPVTATHDTIDNKNRRESIMITNERKLGRSHNEKIIDAIRNFDELRDKLNPHGKAVLGVDRVVTENGAKLDVKSAMGFIRGRHVGAVVVDDFPDESSIYSKEMREKYKQIFYGAIKYIVEPFGHLIVSGTPFHVEDIYGSLKKDASFLVFEYPAIFPDGTLLAPDRYGFDYLMDKKKTDGNIVFSQEILVSPITDASSLFPYEILNRALDNMELISLVSNIESYPIKFKAVAIGCDFAISGGIAADYTVFSVWGLTNNQQYYLIDLWRKKGATHNEQVNMIQSMDQRFKPNKIICEANNFQVILADLAKDKGVRTIDEFTTHRGNKKNLKEGLPSLAALFERDEIKIPCKTGRSKETADWLLGEFNSMGYNQDKGTLESVSEHDDGVMSCYMAIQYLRKDVATGFKAYLV